MIRLKEDIMKHKKAILITAISVVAVLIASYAVWDLTCPNFDYYKTTWGITLPQSLNFHKKYTVDIFDPRGNDCAYEVFKFTDKNSSFLSCMSSKQDENMQKGVTDLLQRIRAAKGKYPNFSHSYEWKIITKYNGDDKLYIIYDKESSLLYFAQDML